MLSVPRLRVLATVARCASFAEAARELSYTPAAVSQQIATLERETGLRLVERLARGVRLSDAGRALAEHADGVLTRLAAAEAAAAAYRDGGVAAIRATAFASAWQRLLPRAVTAFRRAHPAISLALDESDPETSVAALRRAEVDVAVIFEPNALGGRVEGLHYEHLLDDRLLVALPCDHPLARRRRVAVADLADEDWVQPTAACAQLVTGACIAAGFVPRVVFESTDYGAIQGFVGAGGGVALVPELAASPRDDVTLRPVVDGPKRTISAATLTVRPESVAFVGALRAAAR